MCWAVLSAHRISYHSHDRFCIDKPLVSGYQANEISHNFVLDKGLNFLAKPFDLDELAIKVREVLQ